MHRFILSAFVMLTIAAGACSANFQIAPALEAVARELVEVMLRQGGNDAATELAEIGGEAGVRELLNRAAREGGKELVEQVAEYGTRFGPSALKAVERSPARLIRALDQVSPDLIEPAVRAAAREPGLTARLVTAYGKDALELAAKHPGVGTTLVEKLGIDGIRVGKTLSTQQAVALARYADEIAALPAGERSQLFDAMMKAPGRVLEFLETHPKVLLTAGGVAAVIAAKENLFGPTSTSTNHASPPAGLVERVIFGLGDKFAVPIMAVVVIIVAGIACRIAIGLSALWRSNAIRLRSEEAQEAADMSRVPKAQRRPPGG